MKYIITETQFKNVRLKRNLEKLPNFIRATYKWLNPKAFYNFDEFIDRVIFSSTRDFVAEFIDDSESYLSTVETFQQNVKEIVMNEFYDEILNYFELYRF